jgi:chemotaxis regulatin CheY-phosphate phosphatase CheZ
MSRDPESVRLEADYWRLALEDIMQLNDAMPAIAQAIADASVAMVYVVLATDEVESSDRVRKALSEAMGAVADAQPAVMRLSELAGGRVQAIRHELEGDEDGA